MRWYSESVLTAPNRIAISSRNTDCMTLVVDEDHAIAESYGVWVEKNVFGLKRMGIARTTYLIGPDGKVQKRWDKVKVNGHAEEVMAALG